MLTQESLNRISNSIAEREELRAIERQIFEAERIKWAANERKLIEEGKHPRFKVIDDPLGLFSKKENDRKAA